MDRKTMKKVNGGISIYYGITCLVAALFGVLGTAVWLFKVRANQADFSWVTLVVLAVLTLVMAGMAYVLLRVGKEEIEG